MAGPRRRRLNERCEIPPRRGAGWGDLSGSTTNCLRFAVIRSHDDPRRRRRYASSMESARKGDCHSSTERGVSMGKSRNLTFGGGAAALVLVAALATTTTSTVSAHKIGDCQIRRSDCDKRCAEPSTPVGSMGGTLSPAGCERLCSSSEANCIFTSDEQVALQRERAAKRKEKVDRYNGPAGKGHNREDSAIQIGGRKGIIADPVRPKAPPPGADPAFGGPLDKQPPKMPSGRGPSSIGTWVTTPAGTVKDPTPATTTPPGPMAPPPVR